MTFHIRSVHLIDAKEPVHLIDIAIDDNYADVEWDEITQANSANPVRIGNQCMTNRSFRGFQMVAHGPCSSFTTWIARGHYLLASKKSRCRLRRQYPPT